MANQLISLPPKLLRSQPSTHRVHPSTEQPAASNQASTQGKHADHPETCFSLHNFASPQAPEAAARIACLPHGLPQSREQYGCRPALGGRKPKEIKYHTTGVAGVEALPSSAWQASKHCPAWQASKHCPGAASHVSRSSLLLRGVRARRPPAHHPTTTTTTRATPASAGPGATTLVLLVHCSRSPGLPLARAAAGSAALGCSSRYAPNARLADPAAAGSLPSAPP